MARHRGHHRQTPEEIERRRAEDEADREYTTPERLAALRGEPYSSPHAGEDGALPGRGTRASPPGPTAQRREVERKPEVDFDADVDERIREEIDDFEREGSCAPRGEPRDVRAARALGDATEPGSAAGGGRSRSPKEHAAARPRRARGREPPSARRIDLRAAAPDAFAAMSGLEAHVRRCGIERPLLELVELRASQLNRCAYGIDEHKAAARRGGEAEQRLDALETWTETSLFTERERAALAWTEAVTRLEPDHVSDPTFRMVREQFSEAELVNLTVAIIAINGWNRLAIAFRAGRGWPDSREEPASPGR